MPRGGIEVEARENPSRLAARNIFRPDHEAGYTSAVVTESQNLSKPLQSRGVHIHPHMTRRREWKMQGFRSVGSARRFLSFHAAAHDVFNVQRHLISDANSNEASSHIQQCDKAFGRIPSKGFECFNCDA